MFPCQAKNQGSVVKMSLISDKFTPKLTRKSFTPPRISGVVPMVKGVTTHPVTPPLFLIPRQQPSHRQQVKKGEHMGSEKQDFFAP
jgi:hypothetical protein